MTAALRLERCPVVRLPMVWAVPWLDRDGKRRVTRVKGTGPIWLVRIAVASAHDEFEDYLEEPYRVVCREGD